MLIQYKQFSQQNHKEMSLNEFPQTQPSALLKREQVSEVLESRGKQQKHVGLEVNKQESTILITPSDYENEFGEDMIMPTVNQIQINANRHNKQINVKKMMRLSRKNAMIMQDQAKVDKEETKRNRVKAMPEGRSMKYSNQAQINKIQVSVIQRKQILITSPESQRIKEMQQKIKLIAKTIRQKVKKDVEKQISHSRRQKKNRLLQNPKQLRKLSIALSPLSKQMISAESTLITSLDDKLKIVDPKIAVKDIVKDDILGSMWKAIQIQQKMNKYKLKLDPIKHRYPLTSFRKVILEQCKQLSLEQEKKAKQREEKLIKRKLIYNSSRFDRYIKEEKSKQSLSHNKQTTIVENQSNLAKIDQVAAKYEEHIQNPELDKDGRDIFSSMPDILVKNARQQIQKIKQDNQEVKQTRVESDEQEYYF